MVDKIPLVIIFISAGCGIGFAVYTYYKRRREYFYELNIFIGTYLSSVTYSKNTVIKVIQDFETPSKLLARHLSEFIKTKKKNMPTALAISYLKKNEIAYVKSLLEILGASDAATQRSSIGGKREELLKYLSTADEKLKKNGNSSVKLGLLGGLLISVICL